MRPLLTGLLLLLAPALASAETGFWEEIAMPGIAEYRAQVGAAQERIRAGDHEGALVGLRRAASLLPGQAPAHLWAAHALSMLERHDEALRSFDRALALAPSVLDDEAHAFRFTITLARVGQYRRAADLYEQMLARGVSPGLRPVVLLNLADMLVAASCEGLAEAIELYQECVRDNPEMASCHWGFAAALLRAGRLDEARAELETAVRLDPRWQSVNGPDVFFVPAFEVHLYRALGHQQRAARSQARAEWEAYLEGGGAESCWAEVARSAIAALDRPAGERGR